MRDYSRDTGTSRIRPPELAGRGESGRQPGEGEVGLTSPFRCIDLTFRKAVALEEARGRQSSPAPANPVALVATPADIPPDRSFEGLLLESTTPRGASAGAFPVSPR